METKQNELYEAPRTEVLELKAEGVICGSNPDPNYMPWDNQNW
jgi:hypothetical protein